MATIGYARVSAADQNPDLQHDALTEAGCERIFSEKISGALRDRPELDACLDYLREGDVLVVWKLDRLGRSLMDLVSIVAGLKDRGIGFRCITQHIDTTTPTGELIFHIFAALAQYERAVIQERAAAGRAAARARGETGGRPLVITPAKLAAAAALIQGGATVKDAAAAVEVSRATLYRHLPKAQSSDVA